MKLEIGPIIVTPWVSPADGRCAIGCPLCRTWSELEAESVGQPVACPQCSVAKAWKG